MFRGSLILTLAFAVLALAASTVATAAGSARIAALQVGLRAHGLYDGPIDGVAGASTRAAVRVLQRRSGLGADGMLGPRTRTALGPYGQGILGARPLGSGDVGWDVAVLQFSLAWRGFPSGPLDGRFGPRTLSALRKFQVYAGITVDGRLGPETLGALAQPIPGCPLALAAPVPEAPTDIFGPRGEMFHTGLDFPSPAGTPVAAARAGRVTYAGWHPGGWGYLVTVAHGSGVRTMYAHLSRISVALGDAVAAGAQLGLVGASGHATGPHLHFEVRLRGAAVDPRPAFG